MQIIVAPKKIITVMSMICFLFSVVFVVNAEEDEMKIGFNYPQTGPYALQGLDEWRGAEIAVDELNNRGGVLGKKIKLVNRDTQSKEAIAVKNANELITKDAVSVIMGGVSSGVAVAVSDVCQEKGVVFMATISASNATTVEKGHRHTFRVCQNAWMGGKALGIYLKDQYKGKTFFYVTANYTWGLSSETSIRRFTNTQDRSVHKSVRTPFPNGTEEDFEKAIALAKIVKPDVLVLVLFGNDMTIAIRLATMMGLKNDMQIVVPLLELGFSEAAGPKVMEGVIGVSDWVWEVPYKYNFSQGIAFVEQFKDKYNRYPCWGAFTAYTNVIEYCDAIKRAGTLQSGAVIKTLENHEFTLLKDAQQWRGFDHQCVQSVYVVQCKKEKDVVKDEFQLDYFDIVARFSGDDVVQSKEEWQECRVIAGLPTELERIDGE